MHMSYGAGRRGPAGDSKIGPAGAYPLGIGRDERRMHLRAYRYWLSLLRGRDQPSILDLDTHAIADFGPHSMLLEVRRSRGDPRIRYLGHTLREGIAPDRSLSRTTRPACRSLLPRLAGQCHRIISNRRPIGFEGEFGGLRSGMTLCRGVLLPFSAREDRVEYIYGVINWVELVDAETQRRLETEMALACRIGSAR
jgi:hypothetical protein